jgi:hypothetical protein
VELIQAKLVHVVLARLPLPDLLLKYQHDERVRLLMILRYIVHKHARHLLNLYHSVVKKEFSSILRSLECFRVLIWIVVRIISLV